MGHAEVEIEISNLRGERWEKVKALVDTRATLTVIPKYLAEMLKIEEIREDVVETGAGKIKVKRGVARIRIMEKEEIISVWISDVISRVLLGVTTLEIFGLAYDPIKEKLVERPLLLY